MTPRPRRRRRGTGRVYRRPGSANWWLEYWVQGRQIRESAGTRDRARAREILAQRLAGAVRGDAEALVAGRSVRVDDVLGLIVADYELRRRASLPTLRGHVRVWLAALGGRPAAAVSAAELERLVRGWRRAGVADATSNRRLVALARAYRLAVDRRLIPRDWVPVFPPRLPETNVRVGFVDPDPLAAIVAALRPRDPDLADVVEWSYLTGMRRGETASLVWEWVDPASWVVRVPASATKGRRAHTLAAGAPPFRAVLERRWAARRPGVPWVFHRRGRRVGDFRKAWAAACAAAGVERVLFHDLRRSAVRNLAAAGVDRRAAQAISGHATGAVFDRYRIVALDDQAEAGRRLAAYLARPEE